MANNKLLKAAKGGILTPTTAAPLPEGNAGLFGVSADFPRVMEIDVDAIDPNPHQPRRHFDEHALVELSRSIEAHGLLQPITVRADGQGRFTLIAGERRWRAVQRLERKTIFAILSKGDPAELALIENLQRADLHPLEAATAFRALSDSHGYSHADLSQVLHISKTEVTRTLALLGLPQAVQQDCLSGEYAVSKSALFELSDVDDADVVSELWAIVRDGASIKALRDAKRELGGKKATAPEPVAPSRQPAPAEVSFARVVAKLTRQVVTIGHSMPQLTETERQTLCDLKRHIDALLTK